jgi:hypothetical protein
MKKLSRNTRKNKRKNINKSKKKQIGKNFKNSKGPTIFTESNQGLILREIWIHQQFDMFVEEYKKTKADFILVSPEFVEDEIVAKVELCDYEQFKKTGHILFTNEFNYICSYYESLNGDGKLILFFLNDAGRLSCNTYDISDSKGIFVSPSSYYQVKSHKVIVDFDIAQWLFDLDEIEVNILRNLEYFACNERIKDKHGELQELDPVLVALYDFIDGCEVIYSDAKREGFQKTFIVSDEKGNYFNVFDKSILENKISNGKSIFKKINKEVYDYFFDDDSVRKAS